LKFQGKADRVRRAGKTAALALAFITFFLFGLVIGALV
jgi:hypothetical protein